MNRDGLRRPHADKSGGRAPSGGEPGGPPGRFDRKAPHRNPIYWLLLAMVIGWNAWLFVPRTTQPTLALPYSEFTAQLDKGNVAKVRIAQASISGEFVHPVPAPARSGSKPNTQAPQVKYQRFQTTYPLAVGDSSLMPRLRAHRVLIEAVSPSLPWAGLLLSNGLPLLLMLGLLFWMGRRAAREQGGPSGVFGFGRNRGRLYQADRTKVSFADVAGADEAKQDLAEVVDFLRHPGKYRRSARTYPVGCCWWAAGHRQDAAGTGSGRGGRRRVLQHQRLGVRGDVRRCRRESRA